MLHISTLEIIKTWRKLLLNHLSVERRLYGKSGIELFSGYSSLVALYTELHEYSTAISYGDTALSLIKGRPELNIPETEITYTNIGVCYSRLSDYSKAALYLEKAITMHNPASMNRDANYINLLNNLASAYFYLGQREKSDAYFKKGFELTKSSFSNLSLNFLNSYAVILGNSGQTGKGEEVLIGSLERAKKFYGNNAREYFEVLKNYSEYLRVFRIDLKKSLHLYEQCNEYVNVHQADIALKDPVLLGYALALSLNGEPGKALEIVQKLLYSGPGTGIQHSVTGNPDISYVQPGSWSIGVFKAKYYILWGVLQKRPVV